MTRERIVLMQIREYVTAAISRQHTIENECDIEGFEQSTKFAMQLGSAQAYLTMLHDVLNVYFKMMKKKKLYMKNQY